MKAKKPANKPPRFKAIRQWIAHHRIASLVIGGFGLIAIASGVAFGVFYEAPQPQEIASPVHQKPKPTPKPKKQTPAKKHYAPLTGLAVQKAASAKKPVTAIMIENSPAARPQAGVEQAEVVYEAIAEGGITRFLALYQQNKPNLIGPIRSLRPYFVEWLAPYDASVAHVGGSARSLSEIRNGSYRDIDEFFYTNTYWRSRDRYAPHNVYTSFKKIDALNKQKNYTASKPKAFLRKSSKPAKKPHATNVTINFGSTPYNTKYRYNKSKNNYIRSMAGAVHKTANGANITPSVVVALRVHMHVVKEDGWRQAINTQAGGEAIIFQDGEAHTVQWQKNNPRSQITFTKNNKPFSLGRGKTWIAAVPYEYGGGVSWQ